MGSVGFGRYVPSLKAYLELIFPLRLCALILGRFGMSVLDAMDELASIALCMEASETL